MRLGEVLHDRQPQAITVVKGRAGTGSVRSVEDTWQVLRLDSLPCVRHDQKGCLAVSFDAQADRASRRCVPQGVIDEVGQDLGQTAFITKHLEGLQAPHADGLACRPSLGLARCPADQWRQPHRPLFDHLRGLNLGQQEQVSHQPAHALHLLANLNEAFLAIFFVTPIV